MPAVPTLQVVSADSYKRGSLGFLNSLSGSLISSPSFSVAVRFMWALVKMDLSSVTMAMPRARR